jgi:hypothetical protein
MAKKSSTTNAKSIVAKPLNPNHCFISFPKQHLNARNMSVCLESILRQVLRQDGDRIISGIAWDADQRKLDIIFEGGETDGERSR